MNSKGNYQQIIVGIDGSTSSELAFIEAVHIAKRNNAQVYVVQVISNVAGYLPDNAVDELTFEAKQRFESLKEIAKNIEFENLVSDIQVGSPKKLLTQTLPDIYEADLIVLGATGRHVLSGALIGSIAHYATTHATSNVLIVRK